MIDSWHEVEAFVSQDACLSAKARGIPYCTPGGAAGVARQFEHWHSRAHLIAPVNEALLDTIKIAAGCNRCLCTSFAYQSAPAVSVKHRYLLPNDKLHYRLDQDVIGYGLDDVQLSIARLSMLSVLRSRRWDMILVSDYDKGFLDEGTLADIAAIGQERKILVIADPKRDPRLFSGMILKINREYEERFELELAAYDGPVIYTWSGENPFMVLPQGTVTLNHMMPRVPLVNHVGAGDCFLAFFGLARAHGFSWMEALELAHRCGRIYVQRRYGHPPMPEEVEADFAGG